VHAQLLEPNGDEFVSAEEDHEAETEAAVDLVDRRQHERARLAGHEGERSAQCLPGEEDVRRRA
jgi:hypothetical protein